MNINASLFVQMVVFFIGCWITMKFIWPPLIKAIEERQNKIAQGLAAADKSNEALAEAQAKGREIEAEARAHATTIVSDGEKRGAAIVENAKERAQAEADRIIASAKAEAAQEMQRAREQLRDEVAALAVAGAEQILAREVDKSVHAQLLEQLKAKLTLKASGRLLQTVGTPRRPLRLSSRSLLSALRFPNRRLPNSCPILR